jgi:hypothetical protein
MDARLQDVSLVSATTRSGYGKSLPSVARGAHRLTENYSPPRAPRLEGVSACNVAFRGL